MKLLQNKIFALIVCLAAFAISGLIFVDRVLGIGGNVNVSSVFNMGTRRITNLGTPLYDYDATTKNYVDSSGLWKKNDFDSYIYPITTPGYRLSISNTAGLEANKGTFYGDFRVGSSGRAVSSMFWGLTTIKTGGIEVYGSEFGDNARAARFCGQVDINDCFSDGYNGGSLSVKRDLTVGRDLTVEGYAYFPDKLTVGFGGLTVNGGELWVGGVTTIYGATFIGNNLSVRGNFNVTDGSKNFVIDHPLDPENKQLVHSTLEGPEIAVFYRGEAQLQNGKAEVVLPSYFEALTRKDGRTVLLTPMAEFDEQPISNLAYFPIKDGKFKVKAIDNNNPSQKFSWEVKAIRADIPPLEVERFKNNQGQ